MKQLTHYDVLNNTQKFPISIVCDAIRTPENIGMCFRIAESFGVEKIYLHNNSPSVTNRKVANTARNTINKVEHEFYPNFSTLIKNLKKEGYAIIGIEITNKSIDIQNFKFTDYQKIVLLLGNERNGISEVNLADKTIAIPMYGKNSSMNVAHSLAITLYEATNQLKNR